MFQNFWRDDSNIEEGIVRKYLSQKRYSGTLISIAHPRGKKKWRHKMTFAVNISTTLL